MASPGQNVRMGEKRRPFPWGGGKLPPTRWILLFGCGLLVVAAISMIVQLLSPLEHEPEIDGCSDEKGCPEGLFCAARGCVVLLQNEFPDVWAEDVASQLDTDPETPKWELPSTFGEKLPLALKCDVPEKKVEQFDESKILAVRMVRIFDLGVDGAKVYRYSRSRGSIWVGALRFWLDRDQKPEPETVCASPGLTAVARGTGLHQGTEKAYVDGELARAVPADVEATGAIAHQMILPAADVEGYRTLSFDLLPAILEGQRFHTVVAVPLGSDVSSIDGSAPARQRLLTGFIAYYWEHPKTRSRVHFRFRLPKEGGSALNISEVKP